MFDSDKKFQTLNTISSYFCAIKAKTVFYCYCILK